MTVFLGDEDVFISRVICPLFVSGGCLRAWGPYQLHGCLDFWNEGGISTGRVEPGAAYVARQEWTGVGDG